MARIPHPNSPNGAWLRAGFRIERTPRKSGSGNVRRIFDETGALILDDVGYEAEYEYAKQKGLIFDEYFDEIC